LLVVQIALGGWVSTNYAVLACSGFPPATGSGGPMPTSRNGFTLLRELGHTACG
jgi:cytochrome c oxidase assembly protein subunit 15